jgi:hypothetical protein
VERFRQTMRDAHRDIQNTNIFQLRNNEFQWKLLVAGCTANDRHYYGAVDQPIHWKF